MSVLKHAKGVKEGMVTKSSIMLGLGESDDEIKQTMQDLRDVGVDIVTLGQYLQASFLKMFRRFLLIFEIFQVPLLYVPLP